VGLITVSLACLPVKVVSIKYNFGKYIFSIVPTEGIKAASLKVTTSQGSRLVSLGANGNWVQIDEPLAVNEAGFTLEIIDDTL